MNGRKERDRRLAERRHVCRLGLVSACLVLGAFVAILALIAAFDGLRLNLGP